MDAIRFVGSGFSPDLKQAGILFLFLFLFKEKELQVSLGLMTFLSRFVHCQNLAAFFVDDISLSGSFVYLDYFRCNFVRMNS
jgi:hypothetical protein